MEFSKRTKRIVVKTAVVGIGAAACFTLLRNFPSDYRVIERDSVYNEYLGLTQHVAEISASKAVRIAYKEMEREYGKNNGLVAVCVDDSWHMRDPVKVVILRRKDNLSGKQGLYPPSMHYVFVKADGTIPEEEVAH